MHRTLLKKGFPAQPPCLGLQEDDRRRSCATQQVRHRCTLPPVLMWSVPYPVQWDLISLAIPSLVSFHPGEIHYTTYACVWCSLSMLRSFHGSAASISVVIVLLVCCAGYPPQQRGREDWQSNWAFCPSNLGTLGRGTGGGVEIKQNTKHKQKWGRGGGGWLGTEGR